MIDKKFLNLQKKINYKFKNLSLIKKALTHKSSNPITNYEKLEFLGDRVLGLVISMKLLELYPDEKVGILDKKLASLVNQNTCFDVGKKIKLNKFIIVGNSKKKSLVQKKILSDSIESLIGAIFIDGGLNPAKQFILKNWEIYINKSTVTMIDAKTRLQEYSLKKDKVLPIYKSISNTGPRHNPIFKVAVKLKNTRFIEGSGSSKKNAEQSAAEQLFKMYKDELAR